MYKCVKFESGAMYSGWDMVIYVENAYLTLDKLFEGQGHIYWYIRNQLID